MGRTSIGIAKFSVMALVAPCLATAAPVVYSGRLADSTNAALVFYDLTAAQFGSGADIANNVAIYDMTVSSAQNVRFHYTAFSVGGVDPYFTLFAGLGSTAQFSQSNYLSAGGDFDYTFALSAGDYRIAVGTFDNMSIAENNGPPAVFGDGFSGLGEESALCSPQATCDSDSVNYGFYQLEVTLAGDGGGGPNIPEPASISLVLAALLAATTVRRRTAR